jgi:hypothetical protein
MTPVQLSYTQALEWKKKTQSGSQAGGFGAGRCRRCDSRPANRANPGGADWGRGRLAAVQIGAELASRRRCRADRGGSNAADGRRPCELQEAAMVPFGGGATAREGCAGGGATAREGGDG